MLTATVATPPSASVPSRTVHNNCTGSTFSIQWDPTGVVVLTAT
jgi:hypothetical protein